MPISADDIQPGQLVAAIKLTISKIETPTTYKDLEKILEQSLAARNVIQILDSKDATKFKYDEQERKEAIQIIENIEISFIKITAEKEITKRLSSGFWRIFGKNSEPLTKTELENYKQTYEALLNTISNHYPPSEGPNTTETLEIIIDNFLQQTTQKVIDNLTDLELENISNEITRLQEYLAFINSLQLSETAIATLQQYIANIETALAEKIQSTILQQIETFLTQEKKLPSINFLKKYSAELDKILLEAEKLTADQKKAVQEKVLEAHSKIFKKINQVLLSLLKQEQSNTEFFKYAETLLNYYSNLFYTFDELLNPPKALAEENASIGDSSNEEEESNEYSTDDSSSSSSNEEEDKSSDTASEKSNDDLSDQMRDSVKPSLLYKTYNKDTQNNPTLQSMQTALYALESVLAELFITQSLFEKTKEKEKKDVAYVYLVKTYFLNLCNAGIEDLFENRANILLLHDLKKLLTGLDAYIQQLSSAQQQLSLPIQFPKNTNHVNYRKPNSSVGIHEKHSQTSAKKNIVDLDFYPEPQTIQSLAEAAAFTKKYATDVVSHWLAKEGRKFLTALRWAQTPEDLKQIFKECKKFISAVKNELFQNIQVNFPTRVNFEETKANAVLLDEKSMTIYEMCGDIEKFYFNRRITFVDLQTQAEMSKAVLTEVNVHQSSVSSDQPPPTLETPPMPIVLPSPISQHGSKQGSDNELTTSSSLSSSNSSPRLEQ